MGRLTAMDLFMIAAVLAAVGVRVEVLLNFVLHLRPGMPANITIGDLWETDVC